MLRSIGLAAAFLLAGPALGAGSGRRITANDPCTMVTARQVSTFGKPVVQDQASAFGYDCNYLVGDDPRTLDLQLAKNSIALKNGPLP